MELPSKHRFFILGLALSSLFQANAQCEYFDYDSSGCICMADLVHALGQYDTPDQGLDVDGSGWIEVEDFLAMLPFVGSSCPVSWLDTTDHHVLGLVLTEWLVHETELFGVTDTLPAGAITYRLYAHLLGPTDKVLAGYGHENAPLTIDTDGVFYGFGYADFASIVVSDYNSAFDGIFPANAYTTWLSSGINPGDGQTVSTIHGSDNNWVESSITSSLEIADSIGGAWFTFGTAFGDFEPLHLIGQFTITDDSALSGTINLLVSTTEESVGDHVEYAEGLTFSTDALDVLGCTESEALNFNPAATFSYGLCLLSGDLNEDGAFTVADLLLLLGQFGCTTCTSEDLNGDGVVSVQDILLWLSLI